MSVIELTTFTVAPGRTSAMLAARSEMLADFRMDRRGFTGARLVRVADHTWLDIVEWADASAYDESSAKGGNLPGIAAFFATIDALVSARSGVRYDDAEDGRRAVRTIAYGPEPSQVGELYLPEGDGPFPTVVTIHGGWWAAMFDDRRQTTPLVEDLVSRGFAVWNIEYRRVGETGGGWPGTFDDVAAAVDAVPDLDPLIDAGRVVVVGHSAGGQLATWAAHRSARPDGVPGAHPKVQPLGAVTLAGVLDLVAADDARLGADLAQADAESPAGAPSPGPDPWLGLASRAHDGIMPLLLGGRAAEYGERYAATSPVLLKNGGVPVLAIHGTADDIIPFAYSRTYAEVAAAGGAEVTFVASPGAGHFDVLDPEGHAWSVARAWVEQRLAAADGEHTPVTPGRS